MTIADRIQNLRKTRTRYHVTYKDENTACIEPPGECCLTDELKTRAMECIRDYYWQKGVRVCFFKMNCIFRVRRVYERFLVLCFLFCKTLLRLGVLDRCGELLEDIFSTKVVLFRKDGDE